MKNLNLLNTPHRSKGGNTLLTGINPSPLIPAPPNSPPINMKGKKRQRL